MRAKSITAWKRHGITTFRRGGLASPRRDDPGSEPTGALAGAKILVVDDEFGIGELLRDLLSDEGHEVLLAINGRQGLELMAQAPPELVFLEVRPFRGYRRGIARGSLARPSLQRQHKDWRRSLGSDVCITRQGEDEAPRLGVLIENNSREK